MQDIFALIEVNYTNLYRFLRRLQCRTNSLSINNGGPHILMHQQIFCKINAVILRITSACSIFIFIPINIHFLEFMYLLTSAGAGIA
jgi:hypothetical protein